MAKAKVLIGISLLASLAALSQGDAKIVSHLTGKTLRTAIDDTVTTYYKGDFMRTDTKNMTTIFDAHSGKVYVLNNDDKTYSELSDAEPSNKGMKVSATATVSATADHKDIAGHDATKFICNATMTMGAGGGPAMVMNMEMDFWTVQDLKTPYLTAHLFHSMKDMMANMASSDVDQMMKEMAKVSGFPLAFDITVPHIAGLPGGPGPMVTMDSIATSVSEDPLSDDLFKVPPGYLKIAKQKGGRGG